MITSSRSAETSQNVAGLPIEPHNPASVHATYAYSRRWYSGWMSYVPRWYRAFLRSDKIRDLLETSRGRQRLLP